MPPTYLIQLISSVPLTAPNSAGYALWVFQVSWATAAALKRDQPAPEDLLSGRIALEFSRRIDIQDPSRYPTLTAIQSTRLDKPGSGDVQYVFQDFAGTPVSPLLFQFVAPTLQDTFTGVKFLQKPAAALPWNALPLMTSLSDAPAAQQIITGPVAGPSPLGTPAPPLEPLDFARRIIFKATHVPLDIPSTVIGNGLLKRAYIQQLNLQNGEVSAALAKIRKSGASQSTVGNLDQMQRLLTSFERAKGGASRSTIPKPGAFATITATILQSFGETVTKLREAVVKATPAASHGVAGPTATAAAQRNLLRMARIANQGFQVNAEAVNSDFGMLNLERLEMAPAGIERGELVATIPLAPGETTAVVQKEWSVTTKEFTSIVTDSLENYSETGVTDNTELAQSTTNQIQHGNQFNITGTVSGGIPLISGSTTSSFGAQDSTSQSATDSRKHASEVTQKASSRTKQEHKVTISTTTVTGTSESTTRQLQNPSLTDPIRIDYFSLMRKWRVRLYRYGLRATFDIVIPEPAGQLREDYAELELLRSSVGPFAFNVTHAYVATASVQDLQKLADQYGATLPLPPSSSPPFTLVRQIVSEAADAAWRFYSIEFDVPPASEIANVYYDGYIGNLNQSARNLLVEGYGNIPLPARDGHDPLDLGSFLVGVTGHQAIVFRLVFVDIADVAFKVSFRPTQQAHDQWVSDVWSALFAAAQVLYYSQQQNIATKIAELEDKLNSVDTLTLRREESDEIMKGALRFLLGGNFDFMNTYVDTAIEDSSKVSPPDPRFGHVDPTHGVAFTGSDFAMQAWQQAFLRDYEDEVRFINQAIEWENVVTFLYSYFWDMPESWDFIRQIRHPDATRQAFLRAGSARVVLTVRKGWEDVWQRFVDGIPPGQTTPRLSIAQEIAAYDDRNYPGIPPANANGTSIRLEDAVYTTTVSVVSSAASNVVLTLASAAGFSEGALILVDTGVHIGADTFGWQEQCTVLSIAGNDVTVDSLQYQHGGDEVPYAVVQPGEKGALIAEWYEYTPTSGTDIAVTSNLATIS